MNFASFDVYWNRMTNPITRRIRTFISLLAITIAPALSLAQTTAVDDKEEKKAPAAQEALQREAPYGYMAPAQDAYQGAWNTTDAQQTALIWKSLCDARPADVNAQFNWFRSERNARLGASNGRLQATDQAELNTIAERINTTAPGSFEQHLSTYYLDFPQRTAFIELDQAHALDPQRPELILPMLTQANTNGDKPALDTWCMELEKRGGLSPALNDVAADLLLSVDENGIVFTNGDMDAAPALVQQRLHDARRDVLVVDQRLLADAGYRQRMWNEAKAKGPVPAPGPPFAKALQSATSRPVFLALSLDREWFDAFPGTLCATGIAFKIGSGQPCDMRKLEQRWGSMKKTTVAGPLSRNYLLPGAILLQRYRSEPTDEVHASQLEFELRSMAQKLGATPDLIKAGVFAH